MLENERYLRSSVPSDGTFERPWKILNPSELTLLVKLLKNLAKERPMIAAMALSQ